MHCPQLIPDINIFTYTKGSGSQLKFQLIPFVFLFEWRKKCGIFSYDVNSVIYI